LANADPSSPARRKAGFLLDESAEWPSGASITALISNTHQYWYRCERPNGQPLAVGLESSHWWLAAVALIWSLGIDLYFLADGVACMRCQTVPSQLNVSVLLEASKVPF
jgi:hypothetical protein